MLSLVMCSMPQEEQFRLKQELAELAIALNMEAQKGRQVDVDNHRLVTLSNTHQPLGNCTVEYSNRASM